MRNEALDFAVGLVPMAVTGLVLTLSSGRDALVYCGTRTPIPPCPGSGYCSLPCAQVAWVPYSWDGLYLLLIGAALGAVLLFAGIPYPRGRAPGTGADGSQAGAAGTAPERNPSTTTRSREDKGIVVSLVSWSRNPASCLTTRPALEPSPDGKSRRLPHGCQTSSEQKPYDYCLTTE